jgi:hypothetical protein
LLANIVDSTGAPPVIGRLFFVRQHLSLLLKQTAADPIAGERGIAIEPTADTGLCAANRVSSTPADAGHSTGGLVQIAPADAGRQSACRVGLAARDFLCRRARSEMSKGYASHGKFFTYNRLKKYF